MTLSTFRGPSTMSFTRYVAGLDITPGRAYAPFWSAFITLLRSTMEHEAKQARGQSTQSSIKVSTRVSSDRFIITVEHDGSEAADAVPGIAATREACEALGGSVEIEPEGSRISFAFPTGTVKSDRHTPIVPYRTSAA